jgi:hypothetical protein
MQFDDEWKATTAVILALKLLIIWLWMNRNGGGGGGRRKGSGGRVTVPTPYDDHGPEENRPGSNSFSEPGP